MAHRLLLTSALIVIGLLPHSARAVDCQNATRGDYRAICTNLVLRSADHQRILTHWRISIPMSADERMAFAQYERNWVESRDGLCAHLDDEIDQLCLRRVINDRIAELQLLADSGNALVSRLQFRYRKKSDPNPNIDVHATYVEFETPRSAGEKLFNEHVLKFVNALPFAVPFNPRATAKLEETLNVRSIYRSPRFISVKFEGWSCCGAHGVGGFETINVDLARAVILKPDDLFDISAVQNSCWEYFAAGDAFRMSFPASSGLPRGPLLDPLNWSFTNDGAAIEYGPLMNYAGGSFSCVLKNPDLRRAAKLGVAIPP